jgi:hypothetical protein
VDTVTTVDMNLAADTEMTIATTVATETIATIVVMTDVGVCYFPKISVEDLYD